MRYSPRKRPEMTKSTSLTMSTENWDAVKTRRFGHFWPFSWDIAQVFLALGTISTVGDPGYMKIRMSSKIFDLVISDHFRGL